MICPRLGSDYRITSEPTRTYNCFAWAAEENHRQRVPCRHPAKGHQYWPDVVPDDAAVKGAIVAWGLLGYEPCHDGTPEEGYEKVAIYAAEDADEIQHAARQLGDGWWTSKLGELADICHRHADEVESGDNGRVAVFLRRARPRVPGPGEVDPRRSGKE